MEPQIALLIAVFHAIVGAAFVAGIYRAVEYRIQAGILFGGAFAIGVLVLEFTIGPMLFSLTWTEFKTALWSAVLGAVAGAALFVTLYEPEFDQTTDEININEVEP